MNLYKNLKKKVYLGLILVLVLIPGHVSSETWAQKLDLTIPSSEIPLTWALDLKAKREIMMGYECCWDQKHIEAVKKEHSLKLIESSLKENQKKLRFIVPDPEPHYDTVKRFYILNTIDLLMTMHALKNSKDVKEGNFLLNDRPSNAALITHKVIVAPLIEQNMNEYQLEIVNLALELAIIRNLYIMDKTSAW